MTNNSDIKVSVILPVYNVEAYIGRCIESLQAQTLDGLEFIFVDDCSTDGSMEAIEAWAAQDDRVRILRNDENIGAGPSRNRGIEVARGDYLSFVDPDDYVSADFYELLYMAAAKDGGHDIAKGCRRKEDAQTGKIEPADLRLSERIRSRLVSGKPLYAAFTYEHQSAIYRRELFADGSARYGDSRNAQDTTFLLRCCYQTEDIVLEEAAVYFYIQREGSAVYGDGMRRTDGELDALAEKADFLKRNGIDDAALGYLLVQARTCFKRFQQLLGEGRVSRTEYELVAKRLAEIIRSVPGMEAACVGRPQLKEILSGCPLTTPGKRSPGEGNVRVSIVIPVYNVAAYIGRCIESLRAQLLDGLEFIFVDDCSTDGSMEAVEAWAAEDDRARILRNEENLGAGPTRNRGIEVARGDYLSFVDPDDYVSPDFYLLLYGAATSGGGHDISKGSCQKVDSSGMSIEHPSQLNERIAKRIQSGAPLFRVFTYEHWTALYRRKLFEDGARYGTSRKGQDTTFLLSCGLRTNDIAFAGDAVYYYVSREGSAVTTTTLERYMNELDAFAEQAGLLIGQNADPYAQGYLNNRLYFYLTSLYTGTVREPSLVNGIAQYATKLRSIVEESPVLQFLKEENLEYRALVEHNALLPSITHLPEEQKLAGALSWINFVRESHIKEGAYISKCAKNTAGLLLQLVKARGKRGAKEAYSLLSERLRAIPAGQEAPLWMKPYHRLISNQGVRMTLHKIRRKLES